MGRERTGTLRGNFASINMSRINRAYINRGGGIIPGGEGGGYELFPNCWMLEDNGGAWLWEDGTPMLLENVPSVRKKRIKVE